MPTTQPPTRYQAATSQTRSIRFAQISSILTVFFLLMSLLFLQNAQASEASSIVNQVNQRVLQSLNANKARYANNPAQLTQLVERDIVPFIDFTAFSKLILSKHWRTATPAQRQQFQQAFKQMLMRTYTKSMLEYSDAKLSITRELAGAKAGYAKVYGKFSLGNGQPDVPVIFEMRQQNGQWKAYNVTVQAFSLVENFRSSFSKEISQYGLDGLIQRLRSNQIKE
ncbi:MAG: MlaC/ttg2D family ABC transporter substrate-binding protein [bacterium]